MCYPFPFTIYCNFFGQFKKLSYFCALKIKVSFDDTIKECLIFNKNHKEWTH